ncbi:MAG TPA: Spy/CpxP family protein refolding chaperone [Myxococcota bacterium]|nr:Spy/CpxP family protein refolding chaperone [Myxococcota bacterium]HRY93076.1 Spy/CpxP family protein refolding chaperone [Myxococcota bacterium]HSA20081.1 Spy/CpxP family protein refolding chaperone [Myxococcota bacterium]
MNRKNAWKAMGLGLALLLVTGAAWAGGPGDGGCRCGMGMGHGPGMGQGRGPGAGLGLRMQERLGLDEAQQKQVEALRADHQKAVEPARAKLDALRAEMQALWQAERPDRGAILAKQDEMEKQRALLREARVDLRLSIQKLLTPEQRAKAAELQKDRPGRGKFGRGKHGRGGHAGCPYAGAGD